MHWESHYDGESWLATWLDQEMSKADMMHLCAWDGYGGFREEWQVGIDDIGKIPLEQDLPKDSPDKKSKGKSHPVWLHPIWVCHSLQRSCDISLLLRYIRNSLWSFRTFSTRLGLLGHATFLNEAAPCSLPIPSSALWKGLWDCDPVDGGVVGSALILW